MATINPTYNIQLDSLVTVTWAGVTSADSAAPHFVLDRPDHLTVQAEGTFNGGTTVRIAGSLSNLSYANATNAALGIISLTANGGSGVTEGYSYWKPTVSGGTADSVDVRLAYWIR